MNEFDAEQFRNAVAELTVDGEVVALLFTELYENEWLQERFWSFRAWLRRWLAPHKPPQIVNPVPAAPPGDIHLVWTLLPAGERPLVVSQLGYDDETVFCTSQLKDLLEGRFTYWWDAENREVIADVRWLSGAEAEAAHTIHPGFSE